MHIAGLDPRHDGLRIAHLSDIHVGRMTPAAHIRARADVVILTIFVNPTQFGPSEDLAKYPRDEAGDLAAARTCGIDLAFCPDAAAMYPLGAETVVTVPQIAGPLCGTSRPGHFAGVATVVTKLLNITRPHLACFGEKDFQQLAVIRRLAIDLNLGVEIVGVPIVREADGLAMSSRNRYLSPDERRQALALSTGLAAAERAFRAGERDAATLVAAARAPLTDAPAARIDYVELRDAASLADVATIARPAVLAMAVFVGKTRLIDNRVLTP